MNWIIFVTLFWGVFQAALCFNVDPVAWRSLSNSAAGFGYQVVQRPSDLLISAPLEQYSKDRRGKIFKCTTDERCNILTLPEQQAAVNMSLGLTMTSNSTTQNTLACGPTIPKDCKTITMYKGLCFEINQFNSFGRSYPSSPEECQTQADIAFLLDGSGSVSALNFTSMKTFVKNLIRAFVGKDTQFAITQFSYGIKIHYYFNTFITSDWESQIDSIYQIGGTTYTAAAIQYVVNDVFSPNRGSRSNVKKILIVITDGESHDGQNLPEATRLANGKNIVRFAIGVGNAFSSDKANEELKTIASAPPEQFMFQVEGFEALDKIRENLQNKIFSIEGSQTGGETLKLEMSQEGFRAAYVPGGIQMSIVGANQWRGGYKKYSPSNAINTGSYEPVQIEPDSYLDYIVGTNFTNIPTLWGPKPGSHKDKSCCGVRGYSMAVAKTSSGTLTVVGAPRYKHRGAVITVYREEREKIIEPYPRQTGGYFGAEVCAMDVNSDNYTDLILISAPMYKDQDREGRVYVCTLTRQTVECHFDSPSQLKVLRGDPSDRGRFGSSLAVLPDLNADRFNDLAVGAPLENNGQGSIYIFHGEGGGSIDSTYSQRITASEVQSGLKFFGLSISQLSYDQSGDTLPDLAVGSKGKVVLLRSRPVVMVDATVSFSPKEIPTQHVDCTKPLQGTSTICFTMKRQSGRDAVQAQINYTFTLDATRSTPKNRAFISKDQRHTTGSVNVDLNGQKCSNVKLFIKSCPEDALNPLQNELRFTFNGLPSNTNLKPSLIQEARTSFHPIGFEISCGADMVCTDNLKVDFSFTSSSEVKVGIDELLDVTVSVENRGENSYNSYIILTYPVGLSYRKFTSLHGRIECNSLDSEDGETRGKTGCTVDKPIFKSNSMAIFIVSYGFNPSRKLDRRIFVTANASSGNQQHSSSSELYKKREIEVKYSIFMTMESSINYNNFTYGKNNLQKPLQQLVKVTNHIRALNFTVVIRVPVKLGDKDIWVDMNSLQITDCQRDTDEKPDVTDFIKWIKENKVVNCSVARCRVFRCTRFMERSEEKTFTISANLSSGWIEQIGLPSAKFILTSTASLEYERNQYIFFSTASNSSPPVRLIETEVEVFPEPDFTKEIIGGSLGGLAFLALLTAGLYKAGFFKSKYKKMINAEGEDNLGNEGTAPPEE